MLERARIVLVGLVAVVTIDAFLTVSAIVPLLC